MNRDLELAKRVFPDREWVQLNGRDVCAVEDYPGGIRRDAIAFDPLDTHFHNVLAWLLTKYEATVNGDDVTVYIGNQQYAYTPHDGTAAGIAQAVYEAALKVLEGE